MSKNTTNKNIFIYAIIAVLVIIIIFLLFPSSNEQSIVNNSNTQTTESIVNSHDDIISISLNVKDEIKLFEQDVIQINALYNIESDNRNSIQVTIEQTNGEIRESFTLPYSRTGQEVSNSISLDLNEVKNIETVNEFIIYAELNDEIIFEDSIEITVLPEYAFADNLQIQIEYVQDGRNEISVLNYPSNLRFSTMFQLFDNEELIYERGRAGYSSTILHSWSQSDPNSDIYQNLQNPLVSIFDNDRELYIIQNVAVEIIQ